MFEFCCDENSTLGQVNEELGINQFRLTEENSDVSNPQQVEPLKKLVQLFPGCDLWVSIPCGPWGNWQAMNERRWGRKFKDRVKKQRDRSRRVLQNFIAVALAEIVLSQGGHVAFEWPKSALGWALPELTSFVKRHNLYEARTDGCAYGLCDRDGVPHLKPWRVVTFTWRLAQNLDAKRCQHGPGFQHSTVEGSKTSKTALYPKSMASTIASSLCSKVSAERPAGPVTTFVQSSHNQRVQDDSIYAGIHHLIDRKDWRKHPGVQECSDGEARDLMSNNTWDFAEVVPRKAFMSRGSSHDPPEH